MALSANPSLALLTDAALLIYCPVDAAVASVSTAACPPTLGWSGIITKYLASFPASRSSPRNTYGLGRGVAGGRRSYPVPAGAEGIVDLLCFVLRVNNMVNAS